MKLADVERLFHEALALPTERERAAFLRGACGNDPALLAHVERLLQAHAANTLILPTEPGDRTAATEIAEGPGTRIGRYKLLEQIGEGGMGVVYMAQQTEPVLRRVALKIIKLGMDTKSVVARFEAERQALALMDHPNIARVFDGGTTGFGRPYFVMELIQGVPITEYCDQQRLSPHARLELFVQVCRGVQHAHQKGVIHRDLKPSNVLVAVHDGQPVPKIIDFGVAKATRQPLTDGTVFTRFHQLLGTPAYMSPEQAGASSGDVDTRSDVYSLGVLLYELLTGRTPFLKEALLDAGLEAMCRVIREQEPPKPSTRLSTLTADELGTVAQRRQLPPAKLGPLMRGELDWIVLKALEKDRRRRYETADGLARDVERYLNQEPVSAVAPTFRYQARKFARRHRAALATAGAFLAVLLTATAFSAWQAVAATRARKLEAQASERLRGQVQQTETARQSALQAANEAARLQAVAQRHAAESTQRLVRQYTDKGVLWLNQGDYARALLWFAQALQLSQDNPENEPLQRTRIASILDHSPRLRLLLRTEPLAEIAFSPDGRWFAGLTDKGTLKAWDALSGEPLPDRLKLALPAQRLGVTQGHLWAVAQDPASDLPRLFDPATGAPLSPPLADPSVQATLLDYVETPVGQRLLAIAFDDKTVEVWDVETRSPRFRALPAVQDLDSLVLAPNGSFCMAVLSPYDPGALVWPLPTAGTSLPGNGISPSGRRLPRFPVSGAAFAPEGALFATWADDGTVRLLDCEHGKQVGSLLRHEGEATCLAFSPDGEQLASGGADGLVQLWRTDGSGRWTSPPLHHAAKVTRLAFDPAGQCLLTFGEGILRIWDLQRLEALPEWSRPGPVPIHPEHSSQPGSHREVQFLPRSLRVVDPATGKPLTPLLPHEADLATAAFEASGRLLVSVSATMPVADGSRPTGQTLRVWDAMTGDPVTPPWRLNDEVVAAAFGPDGQSVTATTLLEDTLTWRLAPHPWPLEDLQALIQLLGAHRLDHTGTPLPLSSEELESTWHRLRSRHPQEFAATPSLGIEARRSAAAFAERMGRWPEAAAHHRQRQRTDPTAPTFALPTARAFAEMQAWDQAESEFRNALRLGAPWTDVLPLLADVYLAQNDEPAYATVCQQLLEATAAAPAAATDRVTAWLVSLRPNAPERIASALRLAERNSAAYPDDPQAHLVLGALRYRAGQPAEAQVPLHRAAGSAPAVTRLFAQLFLALTEITPDPAAKARARIDSVRSDWERLLLATEMGRDGSFSLPWTTRIEMGTLLLEATRLSTLPPPTREPTQLPNP